MEVLNLPNDGTSVWAGHSDFQLVAPNGFIAELVYVSEPPHGNSYHNLSVNGRKFPGYAWGCHFACTPDSRYLVCSWMEKFIARETVVIDCVNQKYFVLPEYIHRFSLRWPKVVGFESSEGMHYEFTGSEAWLRY